MVTARNLVRHHAAVHYVNDIRFELGDCALNRVSQPMIVNQRSFAPTIHKQDAHLQTGGTQTFDLLLHKDTLAGKRR
jgi:hypothetical protein